MADAASSDAAFAVRPLNARSLVLSVLLGLRTPVLPSSSVAQLGEVFGVAPGTLRTAISRMAAAGELAVADGEYRLIGRLLERKAAQDIGRRPAPEEWDGAWWTAVVTAPNRGLAERRAFRTEMANLRMGELRPETWMRPANLDGPAGHDGLAVVRGALRGTDPADLAAQLWPLDDLASTATRLLGLIDARLPALRGDDRAELADSIGLSAAVVRFLRAEPLLPPALTPHPWPPDELRRRYRTFDTAFFRLLQTVL